MVGKTNDGFLKQGVWFSPQTKEVNLPKSPKTSYLLHPKVKEGPKYKWEVGDRAVTTLLSRAPTLMIIMVPYKSLKTFLLGRASFSCHFRRTI